jgi:mRNA interferase MazF
VKRGELYRVRHPTGDPKRARVFVIVSRSELAESRFSTVICAPVYSRGNGISTEVAVGVDDGLKHESVVLCDALVSLEKSALSDYVGSLGRGKLRALREALRIALDVE